MKKNTMKIINLILGIVFILTIAAFVTTMFIPFFSFDPPEGYVPPDPTETQAVITDDEEVSSYSLEDPIEVNEDGKVVYNLMEYIFTKCDQVNKFLAENIKGYYGVNPDTRVKGYAINEYVTILAVTLGLGLTTLISHICSRKAIFTQISSLAYCASALVCAFTAKVFTLSMGNPAVQTYMIIFAIASTVVFLARLYPWFQVRFRTVITLDDVVIK